MRVQEHEMKQAAIHDSLRHGSTMGQRVKSTRRKKKKQKSLPPRPPEPEFSEISTDSAGSESSDSDDGSGICTSDEVTKMEYLDSKFSRHDAMLALISGLAGARGDQLLPPVLQPHGQACR